MNLKILPLLCIVCAIILIYATGLGSYLSLHHLKEYRYYIKEMAEEHPFMMPLAFVGTYILTTALSLPVSLYLSLAGGFLFAEPWSFIYIVTGATVGATIIFLISRYALGTFFEEKHGKFIDAVKSAVRENCASCLLILRLLPIFPFWLVNISLGMFNIRLTAFIWTTALGIAPVSYFLSQIGKSLGTILDEEGAIGELLPLKLKIALALLAFISALPILLRRLK